MSLWRVEPAFPFRDRSHRDAHVPGELFLGESQAMPDRPYLVRSQDGPVPLPRGELTHDQL